MIDVVHFYKVDNLDNVRAFYEKVLGLSLYKDQGKCLIYDLNGFGKIGFCTHHPKGKSETSCITFVFSSRGAVDAMHKTLSETLETNIKKPTFNETFGIYHFFVHDYEGLLLEFQVFEK